MWKLKILVFFCFLTFYSKAQTAVYRDTIPVYESGKRLLNPWAGGINFSSFTQMDLNFDGKQDIVAYDKVSGSGGKLKTFLNVGTPGVAKYKHTANYETAFPPVNSWAVFFDYDQDGKSDLFTYTTGGIMVYKNTSSGFVNFTLVKSLVLSNYNPGGTTNLANIPGNPVGLPGISDIDGDGDLDILTYSIFGIKMEYHKNMSQELYGHSDSLVYSMVDDCWGDIQENSCVVYLNQCPWPKLYQEAVNGEAQKVLHAGSCIMCFDRDGDGDKELLLGDVSCSEMFFVENTGSASNAHIGDTTKMYPNYPNKATTNRIQMNSFPCSYYLDVDNDGFKDLLASPNSVAGAENYESVWYYKNASVTPTVNFVFQKKNFLQEDMIELGEGAYPVLFDADADGKKDLIVGNLGYYTVSTNKSKIAFYKNIGTATAPSFSLVTRDYQTLSSYNLYSMAPTFGDLDGDGDQDLIVGSTNGRIHYFQNTASASTPAVFSNYISNYQNVLVNNFAYPQLFDVDKNGTLDLLVGSQNGKLAYYKNIGTTTSPTFSLITANFGGVDVKQYGYVTGYSMPFMYTLSGVTKLLVGSEMGNVYLYDNIDGNLSGTFNRVDTNLYKINEGTRCAPFFEDITADGKRDLILGNYAGGLAFFNSTNVNGVGVEERSLLEQVTLFPNPTQDKLTLLIDDHSYTEVTVKIIDLLGNELYNKDTFNKEIELDVSSFSQGIYFVLLQTKTEGSVRSAVKKFVVQ